jgi:energy-converting hydrogenase Eha subunit F
MKFNQNMRRLILFCFSLLTFLSGYSQQASAIYQRGLSAAENLKAIANLGPYSQGGIGFDTRYEGIKGSPRMLDTLLPSFLRLEGQDYYIELLADIDLVKNAVIYIHPKTKQMFSIPGDLISELIINNDGKELVFRTTKGKTFEKEMKEQKFYQVLKDGKYQFIKVLTALTGDMMSISLMPGIT